MGQLVGHGTNHMTQSIESDYISGAESTGFRAAEFCAGQVIYQLVAETIFFCFMHDGQHAEHANSVGDEVWCVNGPNHALAERAGQEGL